MQYFLFLYGLFSVPAHSLPLLDFCKPSAPCLPPPPLQIPCFFFCFFFHPCFSLHLYHLPRLTCSPSLAQTRTLSQSTSLSLSPSFSHSFLFITFLFLFPFSLSLSFFPLSLFSFLLSVCLFLFVFFGSIILIYRVCAPSPSLHVGQDVDGPALVRGVPHTGCPPAPVHLRPALFTAAAPATARRDRRQGGGERALLFGLLSGVWELTSNRREAFSDSRPGLS